MGKFASWYDQQNDTTKAYLSKQAIWHDKDMFVAFAVGIVLGTVVGYIISM